MKKTLSFLKKVLGPNITAKIRPFGHGSKTYLAALKEGFPAKKLTVIGVNGTKGKTITSILIYQLMNLAGLKTGLISSALIYDGQKEYLNPYKMSSVDGVILHQNLREMVDSGLKFVVLEMTSQGLEQHRHWGIGKFDTTIFLNIYPEHIEAHGSMEKYIQAKSLLFKKQSPKGMFLATDESEHVLISKRFARLTPEISQKKFLKKNRDYKIIKQKNSCLKKIEYRNKLYSTNFFSSVEVQDLAFATEVLLHYKPDAERNLKEFFRELSGVPGRMEWIIEYGEVKFKPGLKKLSAQHGSDQVSILVDYAHEPKSMEELLSLLAGWKKEGFYTKVIHILSSDGAGRDTWKRPIHGKLSSQYVDYTYFTTDNYTINDDPIEIINELSQGALERSGYKYFKTVQRYEAFKEALKLAKRLVDNAQEKIIIVSTGVGSEQGLLQPEGVMKWDERQKWKQAFKKVFYKT